MLEACQAALPVDVAVCAAAVSDCRVADRHDEKLKKNGNRPPELRFAVNPDILATLSRPGDRRPRLIVGFAAETERVIEHAREKRSRKGCDWILANDVSPDEGVFGGEENLVHLIDGETVETWPRMPKADVAARLGARHRRSSFPEAMTCETRRRLRHDRNFRRRAAAPARPRPSAPRLCDC